MKATVVKPFYGIAEGRRFEEGEKVTLTAARFAEIEGKLPGYLKECPTRKETEG